jgi:hypothetical protein
MFCSFNCVLNLLAVVWRLYNACACVHLVLGGDVAFLCVPSLAMALVQSGG